MNKTNKTKSNTAKAVVTSEAVVKYLKSTLKRTKYSKRVSRLKGHIEEVKAAKALRETRIGSYLNTFKKANKNKAVTPAVVADLFYVKFINNTPKHLATQRLADKGFNYDAAIGA